MAAHATGRQRQIAEQLLKKGLPVDEKNNELVTAMHVAVDEDAMELVHVLVKHGANVSRAAQWQ